MRSRLPHLVETSPAAGRNRRARAAHRPQAAASPAEPMTPEPMTPERRSREGGGPNDRAFYSCGCGYAFEAHVSTSVRCPHCNAGQAW